MAGRGDHRRRSLVAGAALVAVLLGAGLLAGPASGALGFGGGGPGGTSPAPPPFATAGGPGTPTASSASTIPRAPTVPGSPAVTASPTVRASPPVTASPASCAVTPNGLPVRPRLRGTVVPMLFPLPATARVSYDHDFLAPRLGTAYPYEHVRSWSGGTVIRAHDGIDIHAAAGTPILAPFSGTVIDPATRWKPWDPARYGTAAVVVSDEPCSAGYAVIMVHLSRLFVSPGDHVTRGQRVGLVGTTGNAAGLPPHVHVELRAPVPLAIREAGLVRRLDAIDPYPSLAAADPPVTVGSVVRAAGTATRCGAWDLRVTSLPVPLAPCEEV